MCYFCGTNCRKAVLYAILKKEKLKEFTLVHPCLMIFTLVHPCLVIFTLVHPCLVIFTLVHPCLVIFTLVNPLFSDKSVLFIYICNKYSKNPNSHDLFIYLCLLISEQTYRSVLYLPVSLNPKYIQLD